MGQNKIVVRDSRPNLDGSPFLFEDWQKGSICMNNGDSIQSIMLRYNVYKDEMQFQYEDKAYSIGCTDSIKSIYLNGRTFIYTNFTEDGKNTVGYLEVLSSGKNSLLQRFYPEILAANFNIALNTGNKNDQLLMKKKYFFRNSDKCTPVDKKGLNIISILNENGKAVQSFVKKNKLSFRNEMDLIEITNFANTLN